MPTKYFIIGMRHHSLHFPEKQGSEILVLTCKRAYIFYHSGYWIYYVQKHLLTTLNKYN
jgi:hypothetical protein